eukprot:m.118667 g.118667  ORF g.118667 m.118667 type:complete len:106 (-) comp13661_c1_seq4:92-409(-)
MLYLFLSPVNGFCCLNFARTFVLYSLSSPVDVRLPVLLAHPKADRRSTAASLMSSTPQPAGFADSIQAGTADGDGDEEDGELEVVFEDFLAHRAEKMFGRAAGDE